MGKMVTVRMDDKGRVTVPREVREGLGIEAGDLLFLSEEQGVLRLAKAENPFDLLAAQARHEYRSGRTRELREAVRELEAGMDGG